MRRSIVPNLLVVRATLTRFPTRPPSLAKGGDFVVSLGGVEVRLQRDRLG